MKEERRQVCKSERGVMGWIWGKIAIRMTYDQKLSFSFLHGREALILVAERYFAGIATLRVKFDFQAAASRRPENRRPENQY